MLSTRPRRRAYLGAGKSPVGKLFGYDVNRAGSQVIQALETGWESLQAAWPELSDAVITTGAHRSKVTTAQLAHTDHYAWRLDKNDREAPRVAEIWVRGEHLQQPASTVFQTLAHEAVHVIAKSRGIVDTSKYGWYHRKAFSVLAQDLGMRGHHASYKRSHRYGWYYCTLTPAMEEQHKDAIETIASIKSYAAVTVW